MGTFTGKVTITSLLITGLCKKVTDISLLVPGTEKSNDYFTMRYWPEIT
jgi:hypothetical protein